MQRKFVLIAFLAVAVSAGCAVRQPAIVVSRVTAAPAAAKPLPFKGRLLNGNVEELPPAVAMSLSDTSPVTFSYREELTHDEHHLPKIVTALDPVTYWGAPLGDYGVAAFASLSIVEGDRILGDYVAKAYVSKSYSLYSEPTHRELEDAARAEVRQRIDQKLYRDADRLARAVAGSGQPASGSAGK